MSENKSNASEETSQEGTMPVQAFTTPVIPPTDNRLRQGRPRRVMAAKPPELTEAAGAAQGGISPTAKPTESPSGVAH